MGQETTLSDVISRLTHFDGDLTIYASVPWTAISRAIVIQEPEPGSDLQEPASLGLKYFLEVFIARDFLDGWRSSLGREPSAEETLARVIYYAENDA